MRWIFVTLLVVNLLLFLWGITFANNASINIKGESGVSKPFEYRGVKTLTLVSELDSKPDTKALDRGVSARADDLPASAREYSVSKISERGGENSAKKLCELVGPFADQENAASFVERLAAIDVKSAIAEVELPAGPGYWVYLDPADNRKAALRTLSELQSKGVDSYVIPKGELENGISLGMFSQEELATKRVESMEAIGLSPKVEVIERSYREIWVSVSQAEAEKMSSLTWSRAMDGTNQLERRQNFCFDVASKDNIQ